jgi:glycosyltransferase involved in cell wall biosynthesis
MLDGEGAEVIKRSGAGMVCPAGDSVGLAKTIEEFIKTSPEDRRKMGEQGQAFARSEYDRETLMLRLLDLLEESVSLYKQGHIKNS